jgi:mono/diheme cytochrome c family protein
LCAVPCDRPGRSKPAKDRAAVPDPAPALPIETLGEALAEGINTGHAAMPEFVLDPDQIHDLLSYLKTLE